MSSRIPVLSVLTGKIKSLYKFRTSGSAGGPGLYFFRIFFA